ncbi:MAG: hypothetical protein WCT14_15290 [Treponemataceae bacterium]
MNDLLILESVIAGLLLIYIIRPFVRKFRGVDGLSALPGISFLLSIAVFPSFGFRPELIPLAFFALLAFVGSLPRLVDIARRLRTDDYGERQPILALVFIIFLFGTYAFSVVFSPINQQAPMRVGTAASIEVLDVARKVTMELLIGGMEKEGVAEPYPLVIFGPPLLGSSGMTDTYRAELAGKGFSIVTYSRPGLDFPATGADGRSRFPRMNIAFDSIVSLLWGHDFAFAAEAGARIEKERLDDLRFIVEYIRSKITSGDERFRNIDGSRISIAGYGASGAAALMYAAEADPAFIRSVVAIESPVYSYLSVEMKSSISEESEKKDSTIYGSVVRLIGGIKKTLTVRKVLGPNRGNEIERSVKVPTMILVSDWIRDVSARDTRYATLVRIMHFSKVPCSIISIAGAGPTHYADILSDYPVYAFFAQGRDKFIPRNTPFAPQAAALSASFIHGTLYDTKASSGVLIEKNK